MTDSTTIDSPATLERSFQAGGREAVVRLGAAAWAAFDEVCEREGVSGGELCARAALRLGDEALADKILGLLTAYFKDASAADPPVPSGFSDGDGGEPALSPALLAALDAIGK